MQKHSLNKLLDHVKVDQYHIECYFRCRIKNKTVISKIPFEPFEGKIEFTWQDILFHPIQSYNRYYHTPIKIYDLKEDDHTLVQKAFNKVSKYFRWDSKLQNYVYI
jgi:hypothetical protein